MEGYDFAPGLHASASRSLRGNLEGSGEFLDAAASHNLSFGLARLAARMGA